MTVFPPEAVPNRLYKYRSLASDRDRVFTRDIIVGGQLFFANAVAFNDPFDTLPRVTLTADRKVLHAAYRRLVDSQLEGEPRPARRRTLASFLRTPLAKMQRDLELSAQRHSLEFGICSMTADPAHVLLWSHYAANHTGVCLGFSTTPGSYFTFAQQVRYSADRPVVEWTRPDKDQVLFEALLTKADFWRYEAEWRLFELEHGTGVRPFAAEKLDTIIFGARTTETDTDLIRSWIAERGRPVRLLRAEISSQQFKLEFSSLN